MAFCLSKLSRDRLQGVHPDLVRVVERGPDHRPSFRVQEGLRQAELVARRQRTMNSRHLTGVDLVALEGGEVSRQWEDYFRVAAAKRSLSIVFFLIKANCR